MGRRADGVWGMRTLDQAPTLFSARSQAEALSPKVSEGEMLEQTDKLESRMSLGTDGPD